MLEQPFDEPMGDEEEGPVEIGSDQDLLDQAPLAATDGENLCPCPDEEEEVVLNLDLDALEDQVAAIDADEEAGMPTQDDLAMDMGAEPPEEDPEEPDSDANDTGLDEEEHENRFGPDTGTALSSDETDSEKSNSAGCSTLPGKSSWILGLIALMGIRKRQ